MESAAKFTKFLYCSTALLLYCQLHILAVSRIILSTVLYVVSSTISTALLRYCSTANFTKKFTALLPTSPICLKQPVDRFIHGEAIFLGMNCITKIFPPFSHALCLICLMFPLLPFLHLFFVTISTLRHAVDVGLWMGVVILSSSVLGAFVRWHNKYDRLTVSELNSNFVNRRQNSTYAVLRSCNIVKFEFCMLTHLLLIFWLQFNAAQCFAVTKHIQQSILLPYTCAKHHFSRRILPGRGYQSNCDFTYFAFFIFSSVLITFWITILLLIQAGDVHPNPGPASNSSDSMSDSSAISVLQSSALSKHLSFIHYNVQSILPKLDILFTELCDFDILAFSESWLNASVPDEDLSFQLYHKPERKDPVGDSHGGVIIYVKESLHHTRRRDIEPNGIEYMDRNYSEPQAYSFWFILQTS